MYIRQTVPCGAINRTIVTAAHLTIYRLSRMHPYPPSPPSSTTSQQVETKKS
ncbi:hypothetical protein CY34DRAFT_811189, partial [Suillus luteus UH-Slu-Lm8-n1]